jgi:hypothetical protein
MSIASNERNPMSNGDSEGRANVLAGVSRRRFVLAAGVAAVGAYLAPRPVFGADDGIVGVIRRAA